MRYKGDRAEVRAHLIELRIKIRHLVTKIFLSKVTDVSDSSLIDVQFIFLWEIRMTQYFPTGVTRSPLSSSELSVAKSSSGLALGVLAFLQLLFLQC